MIVIGFCGHPLSGKTTCCDHLVDKYGFEKLSFIDPIKKMVDKIKPVLKVENIIGSKLRYDGLVQGLRNYIEVGCGHDNFLVKTMEHWLIKMFLNDENCLVCIDDLEQENEAVLLTNTMKWHFRLSHYDGYVVKVHREDNPHFHEEENKKRWHRLEIKLGKIKSSHEIRSFLGGVDGLKEKIDNIAWCFGLQGGK